MNYVVIEIQKSDQGTIATLVNSFTDRNAAESAYHLILASAAISQLPLHSAAILTEEGYIVNSQYYTHVPEPEPSPEPEPNVE